MRTISTRFPIWTVTFVVLVIAALLRPGFAETQFSANCTPMAASRIAGAIDENVRITLNGQVHPLALPEFDQGRVDDSLPLEHIILLLKRSADQAIWLQTRIDQMHNRRSPLFHQWLSAQQVGSCYGVADQDVATVSAWLQAHGFKVDSVPAGKMLILFSGTAGQVRQAFHTEIHNLSVHGEKHIANMTAPQIPAALAPVIEGLPSLNNFFPKSKVRKITPVRRDSKTGLWHEAISNQVPPQSKAQAKAAGGNPLVTFTGSNGTFYAVGPQDLYTIYNELPLLSASTPTNGAGQTLAVVERTDVQTADVTSFRSQFGLPTYPSSPNSTQGGVNYLFGISGYCSDPGIADADDESEADLDLQWIGTTAPAATINFVACASTSTSDGIQLSATYIVNDLASSVSAISSSYGACEADEGSAGIDMINALWEQAVAQGQTVVVADGDSGDDACDRGVTTIGTTGLSVQGNSSSPFAVGAGGTDFTDGYTNDLVYTQYWNSNDTSPYLSALSYIPEKAWNSSCGSAILASFEGGTPEEVCNDEDLQVLLDGDTGGISTFNAIPTWQGVYGVGLSGNFTSTSMRNLPDVSLFASDGFWGHELLYCDSDVGPCDYSNGTDATALGAGGTSFVAPMLTGIIALINQAYPSGNPAQPTRQGQADYTFYALGTAEYGVPGAENASTSAPSIYTCESNPLAITMYGSVFPNCIFYNINRTPVIGTSSCVGPNNTSCVQENNDQPCETGSPDCFTVTIGDPIGLLSVSTSTFEAAYPQSAGYNDATGLGSVNITNLVAFWNSFTPLFASTTAVAANPASISGSETTTLTATVTATGRGGVAPPLGTVSFYAGTACSGTVLGTSALVPASGCTTSCNATASLAGVTGTQLGGNGTKSAIGCFSGDGANDAASSGETTVAVSGTKTTSITTVTSNQNPSTSGQAVTLTAMVTPAGPPTPTGTVSFTANGAAISGCSSVTLTSSATASCTTSALAVGTDAIVAAYSGDSTYSSSNGDFSQLVNPPVMPVQFVPVTPCRVVDTRNADGPFGGPELTGGTSRSFTIPSGPCTGIPTTAVAYSLNVTVVPPAPLGYLTIWPAGEGQPVVSTLNSLDGRIKANAAIVPAGTSGAVSVFVNNTTNVVLDIDGYFEAGTGTSLEFYPLTPCRVADTRKSTGFAAGLGSPSLVANTERDFPVLGASGNTVPCDIPSSAKAYSLNMTAVPPSGGNLGYLTVWPTGESQPLVSTLNDLTGTVVANAAIVPAGTGGDVAVYPSNATDLVIDVNGYFAAPGTGGLQLYALTPCRVLDTRKTTGAFTGELTVNVAGSTCAPPSTAKAYVFNATVVPSGDLGYLTLWPDGEAQPVVSTLNALDGAITSNMAIVPNQDGETDALASGTTQLVMDISAYFAP
ncbi:MAG: protease pro-enzyme activation domain-containing protein [Terriglobales bacterium]